MRKRWIIIPIISVLIILVLPADKISEWRNIDSNNGIYLTIIEYLYIHFIDLFDHWDECELIIIPGGGYPVDPTHPNCKDFKRGFNP